jgi:hypothetical protein
VPDTKKLSPGSVGLSAGLSLLALLFYALQIATLADLAGSDPAGNAYAQAYGAIEIIFLWALLAVLVFIAFLKGEIAKPALAAAVILVPASCVVAFEALELLSRPHVSPFLWPLVIPALIPPLVVAYCFWALLPDMRARIPARIAGGIVWGAVLILCFAIVPLEQIRHAANEKITDALEKFDADYASLPADAPLWDLVPFLETRNTTKQSEVLDRIRARDRRRSEAELMLDRGDFPLSSIGRFDLTPSPALCDKVRAVLRKRLEPLVLEDPGSKPYRDIAEPVRNAADAMEWLVGYDCSCDAESLAWENMTKAYKGSDWDIHRIVRLRDPKELGRTLREHPARFSMLTPRAHLKAWLSFVDKTEYHDQALAGARKLDHRTADAVEMLNDKYDIGAPWKILKYLPALDLETTAPLCGAALAQVHGDLAKTLRPKADDPRPYGELLDRLGAYEPLTALLWLAGHGCDTERELSEAEELIQTYQPSPSAGLMLGRLEQLHRKK